MVSTIFLFVYTACVLCHCPVGNFVRIFRHWYKLSTPLCFIFNLDVVRIFFSHSVIVILGRLDLIVKYLVPFYCSIFHLFLGNSLLTFVKKVSSAIICSFYVGFSLAFLELHMGFSCWYYTFILNFSSHLEFFYIYVVELSSSFSVLLFNPTQQCSLFIPSFPCVSPLHKLFLNMEEFFRLYIIHLTKNPELPACTRHVTDFRFRMSHSLGGGGMVLQPSDFEGGHTRLSFGDQGWGAGSWLAGQGECGADWVLGFPTPSARAPASVHSDTPFKLSLSENNSGLKTKNQNSKALIQNTL